MRTRLPLSFRAALTTALAGTLAFGAASMASPTDAAWTDSTYVKGSAKAGTWSSEPPATPSNSVVVPGNQSTSMTTISWDVDAAPGNLAFCFSTTITGATSTPTRWELRVDLDKPPFSGYSSTGQIDYRGDTQVRLAPAADNPRIRVVTGVGDPANPWNANYNNLLLDSSKTLVVRLCVSTGMVPAVGDPAWYSASVTRGDWTDTRACKVLTVTGRVQDLAANPFYFGWVANLDLTDAKARITGAHRTLNYVAWAPSPSNGYQFTTSPEATSPVPDTYSVTSGRMTVIKGTQQATVTACVIGY